MMFFFNALVLIRFLFSFFGRFRSLFSHRFFLTFITIQTFFIGRVGFCCRLLSGLGGDDQGQTSETESDDNPNDEWEFFNFVFVFPRHDFRISTGGIDHQGRNAVEG